MPTKSQPLTKTDVVVVGGGVAGCTMAALLASNGIDVICIDGEDPAKVVKSEFDGRTTAISFGSRRVIEAAGCWNDLRRFACPITDIQITDNGSPVLLEFLAKDAEADAFGWITENRFLRSILFARLAALPHATHITPSRVCGFDVEKDFVQTRLEDGRIIKSRLVIGADGKNSFTRESMGIATRGRAYNQRAIVCIIRHQNPHRNIAVEDFKAQGPFAILPMLDDESGNHRSALVWTESAYNKSSAAYWDEASFNAAITERFPSFYGRVEAAGPRGCYTLGLSHAHRYTSHRMALIADAAHAIHPIAGQGLNLGLRDVAALCEGIFDAKKAGKDFGADFVLKQYEWARRLDNMAMVGATNSLNGLFSNDLKSIKILRKIGLHLIQKSPSARRFFMKQAMGTSKFLPDIIRDRKF